MSPVLAFNFHFNGGPRKLGENSLQVYSLTDLEFSSGEGPSYDEFFHMTEVSRSFDASHVVLTGKRAWDAIHVCWMNPIQVG